MPTIYKYQRSLMGLPYRSMDGGSFTEINIYNGKISKIIEAMRKV